MRAPSQLTEFIVRNERLLRALLLVAVAASVLALGSHLIVFSDDKKTLAIGALIVLLPFMLYAAVVKPLIFPFTIFVLLVPFDDLLRVDPQLGTLTKLVALCAGAALVFWLVRSRRFATPSKAVFFWLALLVFMALSVMWAIDSKDAITKLDTYIQLFLLYVVISLMPIAEDEYRIFLSTVALSGVAAAIYSVYLYHTGAFVQHADIQGVLSSRLLVQFGDNKLGPDDFSATLLLPIAVVMTSALRQPWSLKKLAYIGIFILMIGGLYVNGSRGALLAFACMVGYMIWRSRFKLQLITLSLLALGSSFLMPTSPWARFASAADTGGAGRLSIWLVGFNAFKRHWLAGAGVGNFPTAYDQSFIQVYQKYYANWHRAPHDMLVEFSVELGIIGIILLLTAWYVQMRSLRMIGPSNQLFDMRIALEAAMVSVFVAGLLVSVMTAKCTWLLFSLMAATRALAVSRAPSLLAQPLTHPHARELQYIRQPIVKEPVNA